MSEFNLCNFILFLNAEYQINLYTRVQQNTVKEIVVLSRLGIKSGLTTILGGDMRLEDLEVVKDELLFNQLINLSTLTKLNT
jgi:hypothetical protein